MTKVTLKFTGDSWRDDWVDKPEEMAKIGKLPAEFIIGTKLSFRINLGIKYHLVIPQDPNTYVLEGEVCDVFYKIVGDESEEIEVEVDLLAVYLEDAHLSDLGIMQLPYTHSNYNETIGDFLTELLCSCISDEGFNAKRPYGESDWKHGMYESLVKNGHIDGVYDEDGYLHLDKRVADNYIADQIRTHLWRNYEH